MNYIKSLEQQLTEEKAKIKSTSQKVQEFRSFIQGPKFTGIDLDGSRKDWISRDTGSIPYKRRYCNCLKSC